MGKPKLQPVKISFEAVRTSLLAVKSHTLLELQTEESMGEEQMEVPVPQRQLQA